VIKGEGVKTIPKQERAGKRERVGTFGRPGGSALKAAWVSIEQDIKHIKHTTRHMGEPMKGGQDANGPQEKNCECGKAWPRFLARLLASSSKSEIEASKGGELANRGPISHRLGVNEVIGGGNFD